MTTYPNSQAEIEQIKIDAKTQYELDYADADRNTDFIKRGQLIGAAKHKYAKTIDVYAGKSGKFGDRVLPICRCCGGVMEDWKRPTSSKKPRFTCKMVSCKMRMTQSFFAHGSYGYKFEPHTYRTGFWDVRDLANADEYDAALVRGETKRRESKF